MNFSEYLSTGQKMVLDGPMGTELNHRGIRTTLPLWSALAIRENPSAIQSIHSDYIKAGADIITANTFRTDSRTFCKAGLTNDDAKSATLKAVRLAKNAASAHKNIWIAGSMAPLEDCYRPDLSPNYTIAFEEHREKADWLVESGVDFILIETMNNLSEATAAVRTALETTLPVAVSFILSDRDHLFNGEKISDAYNQCQDMGVAIFSINCCHYQIISEFINNHIHKIKIPLMVYPNASYYSRLNGWKDDQNFIPQFFSDIASHWYHQGVQIIGGCCGTGPEFIRHVRKS